MKLLLGDCLEVMPTLEADSVDAIITDPPYGLSFMGMHWDRGVPGVDFWVEALRVAKPGCHMLAFGGTRTFHRLTCAIEDAGWEIRDCVMYVYGSGFPKSKNIGCKCGVGTIPYDHEETEQKAERNVRLMRAGDVSSSLSVEETGGQVLHEGMQEPGVSLEGRKEFSSPAIRHGQPGMEGRSNLLSEAWELQADQIRPMPDRISGDGPEGSIRNGASPDNGNGNRATLASNGSCSPQESQSAGQPNRKLGTLSEQHGAQESGEICSKCGGLLKWKGFGSALKPAWEPIILARKPIEGTVAANVQKYGTGAMNIDGSRVKWAGTKDAAAAAAAAVRFRNSQANGAETISYGNTRRTDIPQYDNTVPGRFPANLIHDGSEEVVENFPQSKSDGGCKPGGQSIGGRGKYNGGDNRGYFNLGDSGSASRFFYCAKASKADRDDGCEFLPLGEPPASARSKPGEGRQNALGNPRSNHHPTVKPTALMRYLCRLITPPQGIVLDPFMGSGSTGKAAILEGFDFIGIELEPQYLEIAEARINAATKQLQMVVD